MKSKKTGPNHILVLAKGEEVIQTITDYCERERIHTAWIQGGVGAVKHAQIGYYDEKTKEYVFKLLPGPFEVASMQGNVITVDTKPFLHVHAVLSKMDDTIGAIGAHMKAAVVAVTLEIYMTTIDIPLSRKYDEDIGLNLIDA
jgi:predicted DNA-binding protein with PD1-like motif